MIAQIIEFLHRTGILELMWEYLPKGAPPKI